MATESVQVQAALDRAVALGENGVQVAAYVDGELVVDAWTGYRDAARSRPVDGSTVFPVFSVSKAFTATALHIQAERGLVDYDAPLAAYWPEYGSKGKEAVTVRHVLTHRAGVPQMPADVTPERMTDWDWMIDRLAAETPVFRPGTRNTYLSMTFGWLLGEVVRRTDPRGRPFARFVADEVCAPLGIEGFWLGLPDSAEDRLAEVTFPDRPPPAAPDTLLFRASPPHVSLVPEVFNRLDVLRAGLPAVGGVGDARSLARLFAMYAGLGRLGDVRLLSEERVRSFLRPRPDIEAHDETYGRPFPVGLGGLWITAPNADPPDETARAILAHTGAGGVLAWADLESGLAVAICHNRMFAAVPKHPFTAIADAIRTLGGARAHTR